jgi:hypothetical protein
MEAMSMDYRRQAMARAREVRLSEASVAKVSMALHHAEQVSELPLTIQYISCYMMTQSTVFMRLRCFMSMDAPLCAL